MTDDTIHTCSYECERPGCIRAQRDYLAARLTAETSNARGEVEYEYELWQHGAWQAGGRENDYASAQSEANHYAMLYAHDGPVEVRIYEKRLLSADKVQPKRRRYDPYGSLSEYGIFPECDAQPLEAALPPSQESAMDKPLPDAVVEAVARAICVACEENPDHQGDARGNEFRWQDYRDAALAAISAFTAAQQPAGDGCHCGTCTCNPNMTPAVRFDLSPAQMEGAIREHLVRLGWTPPDEDAEPKTLPVPTRVYLIGETAVIAGTPERGWNEDAQDAHNCDAMGCATFGRHVLARVPFTDERAMSQQPEARGGGEAAPPSAPVGVDFAAVASILRRAMRDGAHYGYRRDFILQQALALEALSQQPAVVDGPDAQAAEARAERLAEALRGWWKAHRPVGWTEDQHRSCPHVNLATDAEKALATALLRDQEEGK